MKIAVPDWQGRVSPVLDVAERVLLVDFEADEAGRRSTEDLGDTDPHERTRRLSELGVDVVVCGAVSWPLEAALISSGIRVVALICGDVEAVVRAFGDGTLEDDRFVMPGCCRKGRHTRKRRRRRDGGSKCEGIS
jgi:predicted Fe-Mo cluster-binding NifX family protein